MVKSFKATTKRMYVVVNLLWIGALLILPTTSFGLTFVMPHNGNIVGNLQTTVVREGDTLATIGRKFDVGGYEMMEANPGVSFSNPRAGTKLIVPSRYVLPDGPRNGIVINLAELRLYFYHPDGVHVSTYPIGVGQGGWDTPLGKTQVMRKREHPTWVVPDSILENHAAHGQIIPKVKPPGPDNPLGDYAMNLGFTSIVIHGTPQPNAVGLRSSHGCIRMLNEDVSALFHMTAVGTPVYITHQPAKVGRENNRIYLEAHTPISQELLQADYHDIGSLISKITSKISSKFNVEWKEVERLQVKPNGYPQPIGKIF